MIPERQIQFSNRAKNCNEEPIPTILPPGAIASAIAVNEALKIISDFKLGDPLNNFLQVDLRYFTFLKIRISEFRKTGVA